MLTRQLALLPALLVALLAAAEPAHAASTIAFSGGTVTITADPGVDDRLVIGTPSAGAVSFNFTGGGFRQVSGCSPAAPATLVTCSGTVNRVVVSLSDRSDSVTATPAIALAATLELELGPDSDTVSLGAIAGRATIRGGAGTDILTGGAGADVIDGGADDDSLALGAAGAADEYIGGPGFDLLSTDPTRPPIVATLDDLPNDGGAAFGSAANVHSDVEDFQGSEAADSIVGSAAGNLISGSGGNDRLEGLGGYDTLTGGNGDDVLLARDGLAELVSCGEGADSAVADDIDTVTECEAVDANADARPDVDGDGVRKPFDCDDANPGIRPGAPEQLDNRVDEDCDGLDAVNLDRDRDGVPRPGDCDDNRADVRPGGRETPGNAIDEDCNGRAAPFPRLLASVVLSTTTTKAVTRVVAFTAIDLVGGEVIDVRCDGRGCPFTTRSRTARKRGKLSLLKPFRTARLRPGTVLTVRIVRADGVAKVFGARTRPGRPVKRSIGCVTPPKRAPRPC